MPERVELENVAFEGFMVRREVVDAIGLPDPSFFIFYDDVDFAVRARRAGFRIWARARRRAGAPARLRPAARPGGWKGFYMYRNLFVVHFRYGENALVRLKPCADRRSPSSLLSPLRGGRAEAGNVIRAMRAARGMRRCRSAAPRSLD